MKKLRVIITISHGRPGQKDFACVSASKDVAQGKLAATLAACGPELLRDLARLLEGTQK